MNQELYVCFHIMSRTPDVGSVTSFFKPIKNI
jgi:hypothetical protein